MDLNRSYKDMTAEEKRHSIELWAKFYDSQLKEDFITSWRYWVERLEYLQGIGVKTEEINRRAWINQAEKVAV
ncbi:MAG: hypothetical protein ACNS62_06660 [Candidatus Cyclobacteriaceae bacterium M3_2C_046]